MALRVSQFAGPHDRRFVGMTDERNKATDAPEPAADDDDVEGHAQADDTVKPEGWMRNMPSEDDEPKPEGWMR